MAFPAQKMTLKTFYELIEQNTSGTTPISFFQPDYPGYFVDPSTPIRISAKRSGVFSPLVCVVFNIDQRHGRPISRERLLNVIADIAECHSWDTKMGIAVPRVRDGRSRKRDHEPFIYNMHGDWNMWPGLNHPNAFQLSCSVETEYEEVEGRSRPRQRKLMLCSAVA